MGEGEGEESEGVEVVMSGGEKGRGMV